MLRQHTHSNTHMIIYLYRHSHSHTQIHMLKCTQHEPVYSTTQSHAHPHAQTHAHTSHSNSHLHIHIYVCTQAHTAQTHTEPHTPRHTHSLSHSSGSTHIFHLLVVSKQEACVGRGGAGEVRTTVKGPRCMGWIQKGHLTGAWVSLTGRRAGLREALTWLSS